MHIYKVAHARNVNDLQSVLDNHPEWELVSSTASTGKWTIILHKEVEQLPKSKGKIRKVDVTVNDTEENNAS